MEPFDFIVVGAGASGCVLASRLTENPATRVLLIEAGCDALPGKEHPSIIDPYPISLWDPRFSWSQLTATVGADPGGGKPRFSRPYLQGYGVGGGSNILGMVALRGQPRDYDEWRDGGARGWGWQDVLPYFCKLENDLDFVGPLHGNNGPMPIRRVPLDQFAPLNQVFNEELTARGYRLIEDLNGNFAEGFGPIPMNNLPDRRVSASMAYLNARVRARPNLTLLANTLVERVDIRGGRVTGVTSATGQRRTSWPGHEVLLAAGALQSPALLMRSGIGPGRELHAQGIEVVRESSEVGHNLMNHPEVSIAMHLPRRSMQPRDQRAWGQSCLRFSSRLEGCSENDMLLVALNKGAWHPLGRRIGAFGVTVYKSYSRGRVTLRSADATVTPQVDFNLLSDTRDFDRLVGGLRLCCELLSRTRMVDVRNEVFLPSGPIVKSLGRRHAWNWLRAGALSLLFDAPGGLRRSLLGRSVLDPQALAQDHDALCNLVKQRAQPVHHVCGTCRMGGDRDADAVVDADCRVRGINGLRIIDASIMPTMVSANTHLPVLMIAEKMADRLKSTC